MENIMAVVVTYNRKVLLMECLEALKNQDFPLNKIILIDNASTDGTYELLQEKKYLDDSQIIYKKLDTNTGGAGGFHEGINLARKLNASWVWIMDDDTIPTITALKELVNAIDIPTERISFLASAVYGIEGNCMNPTTVSTRKDELGTFDWHKYAKDSLIRIDMATFVSLLINGEAIKEIGLPCKDYFIWGDDSEYTQRLTTHYGNAYLVGKSIAIHKRKGGGALKIYVETNPDRMKLWYYHTRNGLINIKEYGGSLKFFIKLIQDEIMAFRCLFDKNVKFGFLKFRTINKGIGAFLFKKYDYQAFKNRLDS